MKNYGEAVKQSKKEYKILGFVSGALGLVAEGVSHFVENDEAKAFLEGFGATLGAGGLAVGLGAGKLAQLDTDQLVRDGLVAPATVLAATTTLEGKLQADVSREAEGTL